MVADIKITWKNRESAALDLIKLAQSKTDTAINLNALLALTAIRSRLILEDLLKIALDTKKSYWERAYSLRAISEIPNELYLPQLLSILDGQYLRLRQYIKTFDQTEKNLWHYYENEDFLFDDLMGIVNNH